MASKIFIFGDTHNHLYEIPYIRNIKDYDYFIYLGDGYEQVEKWALNKELGSKFIAVPGNCDFVQGVSRQKIFEIEGMKIFITHGDMYEVKSGYDKIFERAKSLEIDIAMFGHTHYAENKVIRGIRFFNPGSVLPRGRNYCSVGYLEIHNKTILNFEHLIF